MKPVKFKGLPKLIRSLLTRTSRNQKDLKTIPLCGWAKKNQVRKLISVWFFI